MSWAFDMVFGFFVLTTTVLVFLTMRWAIRRDRKGRVSQSRDEIVE